MKTVNLRLGVLAAMLVAALAFSAALWVHREDVLGSAYQGVGSALGQIQFAGQTLQQDPSSAGQQRAAYLIAQAAGELFEASPILAQEGYDYNVVTAFAVGLQHFGGELQSGHESRRLVQRQSEVLIALPRTVSPTFRTDSISTMGRELLNQMGSVAHRLAEAGVFPN